jgi:hypothetical protein
MLDVYSPRQDRRLVEWVTMAVHGKHSILLSGSRAWIADHLVCHARARALGLDHRLLFDYPLFE